MPIALLAVIAQRENVFRAEFSEPVYYSNIGDAEDAARPSKYAVTPVDGTVGLDGNPARALLVTDVLKPDENDGIAEADVGRFLDIVTDRPMTPFSAYYELSFTEVYAADLLSFVTTAIEVPAVFKRLEPPSLDQPNPTRDLANAQTLSAARSSLPDPTNPLVLGTLQVDDSGDYAFDEGAVNLRKRVIRRLVTVKGAFAHLPNYGVGVPSYGKRLAVPAIVADLAAEAEAQISLEPDVAKVQVRSVLNPNTPGLVRFQVLVRPVAGPVQRFDVPFSTT